MRSPTSRLVLCLALLAAAVFEAAAQDLPTIESKTEGLERIDGFFPIWWDDDLGVVWMEVERLDQDFLYAVSLAAGLGSNDVGLDRNQLGPQRLVRFRRAGRKLLLEQPNLDFRAASDNPAERRAVEDAFAPSIVHAFDIAARSENRFLVDATPFIVRDAHGIAERLRNASQGTYRLDPDRSSPNPAVMKSFPTNTEMEAELTFEFASTTTVPVPGAFVRAVAADPRAVTLRVRHSLVELPPPGYEPRAYDPRSGYFAVSHADYATPIGEDLVHRYITRHRLVKKDPNAAVSDPVEPIVYYLDPGTPEPVRSALLEGGRWWAEAFLAAGFSNAFRVEMLPEWADALDARFNMINWVHRSTRGWSYGSTLTDPRTGEIIKGHVTLGSLRVRQDYLIFEGVISPYAGGVPAEDPMLGASLARIRQLSAHEIGHTLGLAHNYASSVNDRASVMDYPAPLITYENGVMSLLNAYDRGIGEWDKVAIRYGYAQLPDSLASPAAVREALAGILADGERSGLLYLTDQDARPTGSAHPLAHLWDNLSNPLHGLDTAASVRRLALDRLGAATVRSDRPLAALQEVLVPTYLFHRYQIEAASKLIAGVSYGYALRGRAARLPVSVPAAEQRAALSRLLALIEPRELALPLQLRGLIPPRPPGYAASRELFEGYSDPVFDPYVPGQVLSELVISLVLDPARAARLMYQADLDGSLPSLSDVLAQTAERIWTTEVDPSDYLSELQRIVQQTWVDELISVLERPGVAPGVRSRMRQHLVDLRGWLSEHAGDDFETTAHRSAIFDQIDRYLVRLHDRTEARTTVTIPPGQPIGSGEPALLRRERRQAWLASWDDLVRACAVEDF